MTVAWTVDEAAIDLLRSPFQIQGTILVGRNAGSSRVIIDETVIWCLAHIVQPRSHKAVNQG